MIGIIGLNHKSAPIEIRERFVFCAKDIRNFIPLVQEKGARGLIVLSTCNRTEFYFDIERNESQNVFDIIEETLLTYRKIDPGVSKHFYRLEQEDAIRHLFRVTSGLDSMALGEYQIVGQIKEAFEISRKNDFCSPVLIRLFSKAFEASKRVRTITALNKGAVSISYAAVELASKTLKNLCSHSTLLIGAGQTGELTIQNLLKKGCANFTVINRTYENAVELANKYKGKVADYSELEDLLLKNDIVLTSTASKKPLITEEIVRQSMKGRNNKPLFFVDLSVPRNVAKEVANIENVSVYDIDDLNGVIEENFGKRKAEVSRAETLIEGVVSEYTNWYSSRSLVPTFQCISNSFQEINKIELEGFRRNKINSEYNKAIEYGDVITNKLIRHMISKVKTITDHGKKEEYIHLVNKLFDLN